MNLPRDVVYEIVCIRNQDGVGSMEELDKAEQIYSQINNQKNKVMKAREEYNLLEKSQLLAINSIQSQCFHIYKQHKSGVDSADDFEECLVCGKQQ